MERDAACTTIAPPVRWPWPDFSELWRYRELLGVLAWRDLKVRYKQTVVGAGWAVFQPLVSMLIFALVFGRFAGMDSDGQPYALFVYAGLLPWMFFSAIVSQAGNSLVNQAHILTKVYFPRLLLPTAGVLTAAVDFGISLCVFAGLMAAFGRALQPQLIAVLPLLVLSAAAALGAGYLLAALTVVYRDFRYVLGFLLQSWMFLSPVVFPASQVPEAWRPVMMLNPMFGYIGGFRAALLGQAWDWQALGVAVLVTALVLPLAARYFCHCERRFADIA